MEPATVLKKSTGTSNKLERVFTKKRHASNRDMLRIPWILTITCPTYIQHHEPTRLRSPVFGSLSVFTLVILSEAIAFRS